jgi:bifunctional UDP-N-acetylglucosamine pyrophosphorylase/glucosamine-1-phosphate N-acetyltransferase
VTSPLNDAEFQHLSVPYPVKTVVQPESNGMADAIIRAKDHIGTGALLILIADDIFDSSLPQQIIETAERTHAFAVIPGLEVSSYFPGGYLKIDGELIKEIVEKPGKGNEPSSFVNISGHYFSESAVLLRALESTQSERDDVYEQAVNSLLTQKDCHLHRYSGSFTSLKYAWNVLDVMDVLLPTLQSFQGTNCQIRQNVYIEGPVYIGNNVKIFENTKIVGPCYIGDNAIIGNNNVIRHSSIGSGCVTGFNTDITRSYIGDGCWFHSNYIGDSILEGDISMGSGSVLANLRLDEGEISSVYKGEKVSTSKTKLGAMIGKHVRIGVNTSIMPGIKIGGNSYIGAGITVAQDIPDGSFVSGKTELIIESNKKDVQSDREKFKKIL